jgi:hypothetical protein
MIGRQFVLLIVICTSTSCLALKGARRSLRLLQEQHDEVPPTTPLVVKDMFEALIALDNNTAIVDKNATAPKDATKKDKKDKKCKEARQER